MITADVEVWQRAGGKWTWAMMFRPDVNRPAVALIDTTEHPDAQTALEEADRTILSWQGRIPVWL